MTAARQLPAPLEHCQRGRDIAVGEVFLQSGSRRRIRHRRMQDQGAQFTGEHETAAMMAIIKWLLSKSVARQKQALDWSIIDCEHKHAIELAYVIAAQFLITMDEN